MLVYSEIRVVNIRYIISLFLLTSAPIFGQSATASDCADAVNICTDSTFAIDPSGIGLIDELPFMNSISNPFSNNVFRIEPIWRKTAFHWNISNCHFSVCGCIDVATVKVVAIIIVFFYYTCHNEKKYKLYC